MSRPAYARNPLLARQQSLGNQAMQRLLRSGMAQAKLTVNQPGDEYEQEADWAADHVMRMPDSGVAARTGALSLQRAHADGEGKIQRQQDDEEEEPVQAKALEQGLTPLASAEKIQRQVDDEEEEEPVQVETLEQTLTPLASAEKIQRQADDEEEEEEPVQAKEAPGQKAMAPAGPASQIRGLRGKGQPLPGATRSSFESRFGRDFSQVRVHTGPQAASLAKSVHARAFTVGREVAFAAGEYAPDTSAGRWLLAHELAHVAQSGAAQRAAPTSRGSLESEADRAADAASAGGSFRPQQAARPAQRLTVPVDTGPGRVEWSGNRVILNNFDIERATLKPQWLPAIVAVALILNLDPAKEADVEGHTDSTGGEMYNARLSGNRANTIQGALEALVLEPAVASPMTIGYGESHPIDSNATEAGRARNRRVEIRIVDRPLPTIDRVELLNSVASHTFVIPALAPVPRSNHGVTVAREAAPDARGRAVLNPPLAPGDRRLELITWTGATQNPANPLEADISRARGKNVGVAQISARIPPLRASSAQFTVWSVHANITSAAPSIQVSAGAAVDLLTMSDLYFWVSVNPPELFYELDAPNMRNPAVPATAVPGAGTPHPILGGDLGNGVDTANTRWDVSRRLRIRYIIPAHIAPGTLDPTPLPVFTVPIPAYPGGVIGNDDRGHGDEHNNPYPVGIIWSHDQPSIPVSRVPGNHGDVVHARFHFQEFVRLDLGGAWRQISNPQSWKLNFRIRKVDWPIFGPNRWYNDGSVGGIDNAGF